MTKRKKYRLIVTLLLICAALLLSFVFVAVFSHHHCDHDGCDICRMIGMLIHSVRVCFSDTAAGFFTALCAVTAFTVLTAAMSSGGIDPVSLKVRLRN